MQFPWKDRLYSVPVLHLTTSALSIFKLVSAPTTQNKIVVTKVSNNFLAVKTNGYFTDPIFHGSIFCFICPLVHFFKTWFSSCLHPTAVSMSLWMHDSELPSAPVNAVVPKFLPLACCFLDSVRSFESPLHPHGFWNTTILMILKCLSLAGPGRQLQTFISKYLPEFCDVHLTSWAQHV